MDAEMGRGRLLLRASPEELTAQAEDQAERDDSGARHDCKGCVGLAAEKVATNDRWLY